MELIVLANKLVAGGLIAYVLLIAYEHRASARFRHILPMAVSHSILLGLFGFAVLEVSMAASTALFVAYLLSGYGFWVIHTG